MSDLKEFIGTKVGPFEKRVTTEQIAEFCKTVGATPATQAPPTFMTICRAGEFELFQKMGIGLFKVLHAEQEYFYENPILGGDTLYFGTTVSQVMTKRNTMHFIALETWVDAERQGKRVRAGTAKSLVVVR